MILTKKLTMAILTLTAGMGMILTSCSLGRSSSSGRSSSPDSLEPAIISKFLRARATQIDKETDLSQPVQAVLDEAAVDCKAKGMDTDPKTGKGLVNLDQRTGLLSCVKVPKPAAVAPPATPAAPAAPTK